MPEYKEINTFGIEETSETGSGDQDILNSLFSDSDSVDPDEIKKIEEEDTEASKKKDKSTPPKKTKEEEVEEGSKKLLEALLTDEEEEEEDEGEKKPKKGKKEQKEEEEESEEEEGEEEQTNPFNAISKELFELGVFNKMEGENEVEINDPQAFLERFRLESKRGAAKELNSFIGQFGEDYQHAFQAIFVKGVNPKEFFGAYNKIEDISNIDLSQEDSQMAVVRQTLLDQGFESEDVAAEIERIKNYGDLESTAQRYHKALVKKEAARLAQMEADSEAKLIQQAEEKKEYIKKVGSIIQDKIQKKEFDGIPINPNLAAELQDFLVTDKYKTPSGETLTEFDRAILELKRPENQEKKVKLGLLLKIMEKDPTLSTIQNRAVSKKSDTLFAELSRQVSKTSAKSSKTPKAPVSGGWLSL